MATTTQGITNEAAFEVIGAYLSRHKADAFRALGVDAVQDRREGVRIWDLEGNSFINCRSSGGVFNFGHHPRFAVDALKAALDEHDMGDWLLPSLRRARGAEALAAILPGDLRYTFFTPSGAEAVEVACKLARGVTGRAGIVCAEHGYHGHVGFSLAMDEDEYSHWFRPLVPGISKVPFGDVEAIGRAVGDDTAAVCRARRAADPGRGAGGPRAHGTRVVVRALGRDARPAGVGQGPRGRAVSGLGVLVHGARGGVLRRGPLLPPVELAAVVVGEVAARVADPGFLAQVTRMGERFGAGFEDLRRRHPRKLAGHRAKGLMMALQTHSDEQGIELARRSIEHGVLAIFANNRRSALIVMPPLVISEDEADEVLEGLDAALAATAG